MGPQIRYSSMVREYMQRLRELSEDDFHSLRGLIILLSTAPLTDGYEKKLEHFGNGLWLPVYEDADWKIAYRSEDNREALRIIYIQDVA